MVKIKKIEIYKDPAKVESKSLTHKELIDRINKAAKAIDGYNEVIRRHFVVSYDYVESIAQDKGITFEEAIKLLENKLNGKDNEK